jgi:O-antigen/teichoic acid export membrane protein
MAVGGAILGRPLMELAFGPAFASGGTAFSILMTTLLVAFPGSIVANAIFAFGHQKTMVVTSAVGGVSNVLFDLLLIPRWGMAGSAVATLLALTISNGYVWYMLRRLVDFDVVPHLGRIMLATGVMGLATYQLAYWHVPVIATIAASAALYFLTLRLLREPLLKNLIAVVSQHPAA